MTLEDHKTHDPAEKVISTNMSSVKYLTHYLYMWNSNTIMGLKQDNNKTKTWNK